MINVSNASVVITVLAATIITIGHGPPVQTSKRLSAKSSGYAATAELRNYVPETDGSGWWGVEELPPDTVCRRLSVTYRGSPVHIPRGAYSDLANIHHVQFESISSGLRLLVRGGDAGAGYRCYLVLEGGRLVRRRAEDGEFPKNFYAVTEYVSKPVEEIAEHQAGRERALEKRLSE